MDHVRQVQELLGRFQQKLDEQKSVQAEYRLKAAHIDWVNPKTRRHQYDEAERVHRHGENRKAALKKSKAIDLDALKQEINAVGNAALEVSSADAKLRNARFRPALDEHCSAMEGMLLELLERADAADLREELAHATDQQLVERIEAASKRGQLATLRVCAEVRNRRIREEGAERFGASGGALSKAREQLEQSDDRQIIVRVGADIESIMKQIGEIKDNIAYDATEIEVNVATIRERERAAIREAEHAAAPGKPAEAKPAEKADDDSRPKPPPPIVNIIQPTLPDAA